MSTAIEVSGLTMSYADRRVLTGVDFEVKTGEVFCLLGPTGPASPPPSRSSKASGSGPAGRSASSAWTRGRSRPSFARG